MLLFVISLLDKLNSRTLVLELPLPAMRVNARTAIVGETVVLVPYRYVSSSVRTVTCDPPWLV
jgi:hypothetical protein